MVTVFGISRKTKGDKVAHLTVMQEPGHGTPSAAQQHSTALLRLLARAGQCAFEVELCLLAV